MRITKNPIFVGFFVINKKGNLSAMNDRIISIDVLRGFALLGILIMNITSFAMPSMSYFSPLVYDVSFKKSYHLLYQSCNSRSKIYGNIFHAYLVQAHCYL